LQTNTENTQAKLEELKSASDEAWETIKGGVEKASVDLKSAIDGALSEFK